MSCPGNRLPEWTERRAQMTEIALPSILRGDGTSRATKAGRRVKKAFRPLARKDERAPRSAAPLPRLDPVEQVLDDAVLEDACELREPGLECPLQVRIALHERPLPVVDRSDAVEHALAIAG